MNVAIVGAGVSGLVAAQQLEEAGHLVTVFEAGERPGGHTNTIEVEAESGRYRVDTGFIVFNDRNYPSFTRLLERLEVPSQLSSMSFSVSDGDFEFSSRNLNGLLAKRSHALDREFGRMLLDVLRFQREAPALVGAGGDGPSLAAFLDDGGYSPQFVEKLIVPQVSAVWSADPGGMGSFPAGFLAEFFAHHGMLGLRNRPSWRTVAGGSSTYVEALVEPFADRLRPGTPVTSVRRFGDRVELTPGGGPPVAFDHLVLATHADTALAILADPSDREAELLGAFPYQPNVAVLHTDASLLPRRRRAWASWNFHLRDEPPDRTLVTYDMNRLQSLRAPERFCVTLNLEDRIDPDAVIRRIEYSHPVFTQEGIAAQRRWHEISGGGRTHYCGAYWGWGFHEDGVVSGLRAARALGGRGL